MSISINHEGKAMHKDTKPQDSKGSSSTPKPADNQGEGDKRSAERFNKEEQNFVQSEHGRAMIDKAGEVDPSEERHLSEAERAGRARTKGEDPAVTRKE